MTRGVGRSTVERGGVLLAAALALALGCGDDKPSVAGEGRSGSGGQGGSAGDDAAIEDASDGDSAVEEQSGGTGGAGSGGAGSGGAGTGGDGGAGSGGAGEGGAGSGGEGGDGGGEPDPDASVEGDAGPQDAVCLEAGEETTSSASGACDSPIVIDMGELGFGDALFHRTGTDTTNGLVPNIEKCAEGTGRDIVFNVETPGTADLEVSVDAEDGSDPIILVQNGPDIECDKSAATLCVDDTSTGECEYLRIPVAAGGYEENTPQIVISETEPSNAALTVRFRLLDPGGGS